jgi:hypothetical protein|tara:strand:+ start:559 stop:669 length:111 start_codon:yes stop_codon:yes gene_type:complete
MVKATPSDPSGPILRKILKEIKEMNRIMEELIELMK